MASNTGHASFWACCIDEFGDFIKIKILERFQAMISLQKSQGRLIREMKELFSYRTDKEGEAKAELKKNFRWKPRDVLTNWLTSVDELKVKVDKFDRDLNGPRVHAGDSTSGGHLPTDDEGTAHRTGDSGGCTCGLCKEIKTCCCCCCCGLCILLKRWGGRLCVLVRLSGEAADLIGEVRDLKKIGDGITQLVIEAEGGPEAGGIFMVGDDAEVAFKSICSYLEDDMVGMVAIYGMGGVGKTDLLKKIKRHYSSRPEYPRVICAEVTRTCDMDQLPKDPWVVDTERLRNSIGNQIQKPPAGGAPSVQWDAESLKEALGWERFLLLLENVWEILDLDDIGIPIPGPLNKSKIVFTTRSDAVCAGMAAKGVKLNRLTQDEGLKLFGHLLDRQELLNRHEREANIIVDMCHGLPLAIRVMARVMSNKTGRNDWSNTIKALGDPRKKFNEMRDEMRGEEVLRILRYSYYHLKAEVRPCLLYCSLFGNNMDIGREELIDYWLGEGFLDSDDVASDVAAARNNGSNIINQLVSACLLECSSLEEDKVKMHGLIRDMAITIAAGKFLVYPDSITSREQEGENWEQAERISLMGSIVPKLPTRNCPNLVTLLLSNCQRLASIPPDFFDEMSALRVLDLSRTRIQELPRGIKNLKQMRHLNLSHTDITSLPEETGELENLIQLNLSFTADLASIPYKAITGLLKLRTLNLSMSKYQDWVWDNSDPARGVSLSDLEGLRNLEELSLNIKEQRGFADLLGSADRLGSTVVESTVCLYLEGFRGLTSLRSRLEVLRKLEELHIANVLELPKLVLERKWFLKLKLLQLSSLSVEKVSIDGARGWNELWSMRRVDISMCNHLEDLSWIRHMVCLQSLSVSSCNELKVVIAGEGGHQGDNLCFQSLYEITLTNLPKLECFCKCYKMTMSVAPRLTVGDCPKLMGEFVYHDKQGKQNKIPYQDCQQQATTRQAPRA